MDDLDWDDLRYFLRALQAGTLAGAARSMGVEHTTVGRRLSALERALGLPLVVRGPTGLSATAIGARVLALAEDLQQRVDGLRSEIASRSATVRLVAPSGFAPLLGPVIERLRAREPPTAIELLSSSRAVDLVHGEADVAIRIGPVAHQDLVARKIGRVGWAVYAAQSYVDRRGPIDAENLRGHAVIGFDASMAAMPPARWLADRCGPADVVLRGREMIDLVAAAVAGLGVAVLSCLAADREPTLVRLTDEPVATRELALVYRRESGDVPAVRAVIDELADELRAQSGRLAGTSAPRATAPR